MVANMQTRRKRSLNDMMKTSQPSQTASKPAAGPLVPSRTSLRMQLKNKDVETVVVSTDMWDIHDYYGSLEPVEVVSRNEWIRLRRRALMQVLAQQASSATPAPASSSSEQLKQEELSVSIAPQSPQLPSLSDAVIHAPQAATTQVENIETELEGESSELEEDVQSEEESYELEDVLLNRKESGSSVESRQTPLADELELLFPDRERDNAPVFVLLPTEEECREYRQNKLGLFFSSATVLTGYKRHIDEDSFLLDDSEQAKRVKI